MGFRQWLKAVSLRRLVIFDLCSKYFYLFPSDWAEHTAGETLLLRVILGCTKTLLGFVIISNLREDSTNGMVPRPFAQTPAGRHFFRRSLPEP